LDRFSMSAKNIALPAEIEFLYTTGKLRGFSGDPRRPLLDDWLNNGGTIDIEKGEMIWNPLMTEFSATVGLTPSLEPMVAAAAKTYGFFAFLSLLENRGALKNSDVSVAKIVLGKKLKMENGENQPSLTSSFSLQSGKLYVGQVLLYDFKK